MRDVLDLNGYENMPLMAYAVKYSSAFISRLEMPQILTFIWRSKTYQMDPANRLEAIKRTTLGFATGADILMVKPALSYLDIIREVKINLMCL